MSFLQRLRMNNVFGGDMFTPIQSGIDPYREIINDFRNQQMPMGNVSPMARQSISRPMATNNQPDGLRFGGVFDSGNNPGADIIARGARDTNNIYESYKKPALQAGNVLAAAGIKPNEQFPGERDALDLDHEIKKTNLEIAKRRMADTEKRTSIAEYKAKNPNLKFVPVKGGNVIAVDQQTGDHFDTGIATGTLSEADAIEMRGEQARETNKEKPVKPEKPLLPTQDKVQLFNKAKELYDRNPAYRDFIKLGEGTFDIQAPGKSLFGGNTGPEQTVYDAIIKQIYGDHNPTTQAVPVAPVVNPTERIRVRDKATGKTGTISAGAFNPTKYDKVQ